jgi:hypothetical protein
MDDDRATVTVPVAVADVAFAITVVAPAAALALFAAAVARKRLAPLGRFTRPIVPLLPFLGNISVSIPIPIIRSRSTRRRNGLGRFSSLCMSYIGSGGCAEVAESLKETVWVLPDEDEDDDDEDDDDDDDEEEEPVFVVVIVGSSGFAESAADASTRLIWVREDTDGRRRRLVR